MGSLCDSCYAPGACCKHFTLFGCAAPGDRYKPLDEGRAARAIAHHGFPFEVIPDAGGAVRCTRLQADGRCGDYENRPDLCRTLEPGMDPLCVHWRGAEGSEPWI